MLLLGRDAIVTSLFVLVRVDRVLLRLVTLFSLIFSVLLTKVTQKNEATGAKRTFFQDLALNESLLLVADFYVVHGTKST